MKPIQIELRDDGDWKVITFTGQEMTFEKQENVLNLIGSQLNHLKALQIAEAVEWRGSREGIKCQPK
jgi:hypothetical protein